MGLAPRRCGPQPPVAAAPERTLAVPTPCASALIAKLRPTAGAARLTRALPHVSATFGLTEAAAALRHVADRKAIGKVVLDIS